MIIGSNLDFRKKHDRRKYAALVDAHRICELANYDKDKVLGKTQKREPAAKRRRVMYILRSVGYSFLQIGYALSRDHTTCVYGYYQYIRENYN